MMIQSNVHSAKRAGIWMLMFVMASASGTKPHAESNDDMPHKSRKPSEAEKQFESAAVELQEQAIRELRKVGLRILRKHEDEDQQAPPRILSIGSAPGATKIAVDHLEPLKYLPSLRIVFVNNCELTDQHLMHFSKLPNINRLELNQTKLTDKDLKPLKNMPNLERLDLMRL